MKTIEKTLFERISRLLITNQSLFSVKSDQNIANNDLFKRKVSEMFVIRIDGTIIEMDNSFRISFKRTKSPIAICLLFGVKSL